MFENSIKRLVPLILLSFFFILVFFSVNSKSPICDESGHHIGVGYSYLKTHDFRMNPSSPPLLRLIMAAPLLPLDLKLPLDNPSWETINSTQFNYQFLYVYNFDADKIVFFARLPMLLLSIILGYFIYLWSKKLYGYSAGIFSLFLYVMSPVILANAGLAMLDMGCSLFVFLAIFSLWRLFASENYCFKEILICGIWFGCALASKISSVLLFPLFIVFSLIKIFQSDSRIKELTRQVRILFMIFITAIILLWASYGFEFKPLLRNAPDAGEKIEYIKKFSEKLPLTNKEKVSKILLYHAQYTPVPLGEYFIALLGIGNQAIVGQQGVYFNGKEYREGVKLYYLVDFLIKNPIPFLVIILLAIIFMPLWLRPRSDFLSQAFLLLPIIAFFVSLSFSKLQGGIRYLLPAYPFLCVWLGGAIHLRYKRFTGVFRVCMTLLCIWYAYIALAAFPNYLAYFNEFVGGANGFGHKVVKDFDWGQDLPSLAKYLKEQKTPYVKLLYFGTAEPKYYEINYKTLSKEEFKKPKSDIYAISGRWLDAVEWTSEVKPAAKIGYSIFIYDFRKKSG